MLKSIIFSLIKLLPPEVSHSIVIYLLKYYPLKKKFVKKESLLATDLFGYKLSNPLGLAAGFDKNGDALQGLLKLNFSFIEIGTVTPLSQKGNSKPRLHRIIEEESIINSLGFPNKGVLQLVQNLSAVRKYHPLGREPIIGVNIGCNKESSTPIDDFIFCLQKVYKIADYVTINVSSPNTAGLRNFQKKENLNKLLTKINLQRNILNKQSKRTLPLVLKIAPDINDKLLKDLIDIAFKKKLDGIIATNTTIDKNVIKKSMKSFPNGGISGKPLYKKSNKVLEKVKKFSKGKIQIIGVGGIQSGETAYEKIKLGSSAVQLYSGLVYKGPDLIEDILSNLLNIFIKSKK